MISLRKAAKRDADRRGKTETLFVGLEYDTKEGRERTADALFSRAKSARTMVEAEWTRFNDYYNFIHDMSGRAPEAYRGQELPFSPACVPDPWIMVESQVDPNVPEPEFHGRDTDQDSEKARQREYATKYIMENNRIWDMNTRNERRLLKYGDAFWKAYWDPEMRCGINEGDIRIADIPVEAVYPDPAIASGTIQDGEYLDYVYRMPLTRFWRVFRRELNQLDVTPEEMLGKDYTAAEGIFDLSTAIDEVGSTIQILEHWFRQPEDGKDPDTGEEVPAGCVACTIQAGGHELRYIPNYWKSTCRQNQLFPFVQYWRIQDENRVWNKSELFPILDTVDAADRKLNTMLLNEELMGNDIILMEEGSLADGQELTNEPGAIVRTKPGRIGNVARLGGMQPIQQGMATMEWLQNTIERTNRNYETNLGKESSRQTTATGLAMLRQDAQGQSDIKKADRNNGFERLYELLDWLALEFFDDGRLLYLGANEEKGRQDPVSLQYASGALADMMPEIRDGDGKVVRKAWKYWPKVDVTITAGDSVIQGKQETLQALATLTQSQITQDNWKLFAQQLRVLDIPDKQDIIDGWTAKFQGALTEEELALLAANPQLKAAVEQMILLSAQTAPKGGGPMTAAPPAMPAIQNEGGGFPL